MAPKKKERESENFEQKKTDHIQADQEMFLNAFESEFLCTFFSKFNF